MRLLAGALIAALLLQRGVYHAAYLLHDPFALVTFSDGQLYEEAARDIVAHPPFGTEPLYLQGLYAYVLALGIALRGSVVDGLCVQLALSLGALWLLARACRTQYGPIAGTLSVLVLLACSDLAFYENKYLSVAIGNACNALAIVAFVAASRSWSKRALLLLGVASGLCVLGRPNLLIALPFTLLAVMVGTRGRLDARG
ncbi:MAG TPA: glycosyltransferase family 39 protein, partial [Polyangiales bacterium]|nr:glycosyltransferase family 39 protein [Polyangiales bacterium]